MRMGKAYITLLNNLIFIANQIISWVYLDHSFYWELLLAVLQLRDLAIYTVEGLCLLLVCVSR